MSEFAVKLQEHNNLFEQFKTMVGKDYDEKFIEKPKKKEKTNYAMLIMAAFALLASCSITYIKV